MFALCPLPATETWLLQVGHSDRDGLADSDEFRALIAGLVLPARRTRAREPMTSAGQRRSTARPTR
jgi:hypothetical protein